MPDLIKNFAYCQLVAGVTAGATTLPVDTTVRLPDNSELAAADFWMTIDSTLADAKHEIIKVTALSQAQIEHGPATPARQPFISGSTSAVAQRVRVTSSLLVGGLLVPMDAAGKGGGVSRRIGIAADFTTGAAVNAVPWLTADNGQPAYVDGVFNALDVVANFPSVTLVPAVVYQLVVVNADGVNTGVGAISGNYVRHDDQVIYALADQSTFQQTLTAGLALRLLEPPVASLTVVRGQEGTTPQAHDAGTVIKSALTKAQMDRRSVVSRGLYHDGTGYPAGSVVQHLGSLWRSLRPDATVAPGADPITLVDVGGTPVQDTQGNAQGYRNVAVTNAPVLLGRVQLGLNAAVSSPVTLNVKTTSGTTLATVSRASLTAGLNDFNIAVPVQLAADTYHFELTRDDNQSFNYGATNAALGGTAGIVTSVTGFYGPLTSPVSDGSFRMVMRLFEPVEVNPVWERLFEGPDLAPLTTRVDTVEGKVGVLEGSSNVAKHKGVFSDTARYAINDIITHLGLTYLVKEAFGPLPFTDEFDRPDGNVGNGWLSPAVTDFQISNGRLVFGSTTSRYVIENQQFIARPELPAGVQDFSYVIPAGVTSSTAVWAVNVLATAGVSVNGWFLRQDTATGFALRSMSGSTRNYDQSISFPAGVSTAAAPVTVRVLYTPATGRVQLFANGQVWQDFTAGIQSGRHVGVSPTIESFSLAASTGIAFDPTKTILLSGLSTRQTAVLTTASLAAGARADAMFTLAPGYRLLDIGANRPCRVRLYSSQPKRDGDVARAVGTDPPKGSGLMLDYVVTTSDGEQEGLSPLVDGYVSNGSSEVYASITNNDTVASTVEVTLLWVRTE